VVRQLIPL